MCKYLNKNVGIYTWVYLHVRMRMYVCTRTYACTFIIPTSPSVAVFDMYAYILHSCRRCRED